MHLDTNELALADDRWDHDAYEQQTPDKRLRDEIIKLGEVVSNSTLAKSTKLISAVGRRTRDPSFGCSAAY